MSRTRPPYPREFKEEAVRLVKESKKPISQIAQDLGVSDVSLREWVKRYEIDAGEREGLTTAEREELGKLRREIRILREEREILKKAAAFFAQETNGIR
jgi:transposase